MVKRGPDFRLKEQQNTKGKTGHRWSRWNFGSFLVYKLQTKLRQSGKGH